MDLTAIPDLRVESAGDEVTYHLPARPLGWVRILGLIPLGFSALWIGGIGRMLWPQLHQLINNHSSSNYIICGFLFCFVLAGCAPAGMGLMIMLGRGRIRWRDNRLTASEMLGPLAWPKRLPRGTIKRFLVLGTFLGDNGNAVTAGPLSSLGALMAEYESSPRRALAIGYPRPWLEAIARDLSPRMGLAQTVPSVKVLTGLASTAAENVTEKPANSSVIVQNHPGGITLDIPPPGFRKGTGGLFFFAIIWCSFVAAMIAAILFGHTSGPQNKLPPLLFMSVFSMVGIGMLLASINMAKRRITLTAGPSELTIVTAGPFGVKRRDFRRPDIASVRVGRSNIESNHRPWMELQVHLTTGKKEGFLAGRDEEELGWIAAELRKAMGMQAPTDSPASMTSGWPGAMGGRLQTKNSPLGALVALIFVGVICFLFYLRLNPHVSRLAPDNRPARTFGVRKPAGPANTANGVPGMAFDAFGPHHSRGTNAWAVLSEAHAEWFVAEASGNLKEIEVAIAPPPNVRVGKATVFLAEDRNGYPGATLESFSFKVNPHDEAELSEPVLLVSTKHPPLQRGVKYWLAARSGGRYAWYFNNRNIMHNTAREIHHGQWASAGDYCYVSAFSIALSTNIPDTPARQPAVVDSNSTTNQ
jgi:hypothetical protein